MKTQTINVPTRCGVGGITTPAQWLLQSGIVLHEIDHLVLDFSDTVYIDSSGLGALIFVKNKCDEEKTALTLTNMIDHIKSIFLVAKFDKIFDIR